MALLLALAVGSSGLQTFIPGSTAHTVPRAAVSMGVRNFINRVRTKSRVEKIGATPMVSVDGVVGPSPSGSVTEGDVFQAQAAWANAIKSISKTYLDDGDYIQAAADAAGELYGYGKSNVLFKPTKAAEYPFRATGEQAMSYFVGGAAVENGYDEDAGFAINGGKGWSDVVFTNHQIDCNGDTAMAMGSYVFTCATTGDETKVEYTFGYKRNDDGKMRIFVHHSSVPYAAAPLGPAVTEDDVLACQKAWANAIQRISSTYKKGGDFVDQAATAAGELYGYGKSNVLFKPTKASEVPFRPTGAEAMSYFVGASAVDDGYDEDAGFAINGGKGWSNVEFTNHQIDCNGNTAMAMGSYVFTCATTGDETKVEYTFGYKRNDDGKVRIFVHHSSVPYSAPPPAPGAPITEEEVLAAQGAWAGAIIFISATYLKEGDYVQSAAAAAGELYGYGKTNVLFKPTKATDNPFRATGEEAMSYFVGGAAVPNGYKEDAGFAINGGKGWSNVQFNNHQIDLNGDFATAMGSYVFTCATTGDETRVEYTFGYKRNDDGNIRILLHHSSVPYKITKAPVTEAEVLACQNAWANAIKSISQSYLDGGDYVQAAAFAAGELYGYGKSNVLFKPTKAAQFPFRPTGEEAMSYFVGCSAVDNGYKEDAGFAINGGKGWKDVVFTNHQIDCNGDTAIAMGSYLFTCATTGDETKVEYSFGYKRNEDGKARIFLHHSSVPYSS